MNFSKLNLYSSNTQYENKIHNTEQSYNKELIEKKKIKYNNLIKAKSLLHKIHNKDLKNVSKINNKDLNIVNKDLNIIKTDLNSYNQDFNIVNNDSNLIYTLNNNFTHFDYNPIPLDNKPKDQFNFIIKMLQLTTNTIENIYQLKYNNDINASGLGDFIRGSYFLMQFCKKYNISYNINLLNHPISQFLDIYKNKKSLNYTNINKFGSTNHNPFILHNDIITNIYDDSIDNEFLNFLSKQTVFNKTIYIYTITYPTNIIDQEDKDTMKKLFKPTDNLSLLVDIKLTNLKLVKYKFEIIHIRYGDQYLIDSDETINETKFMTVISELKKLNSSKIYLLISDNNIIKKKILKYYPFLKTDFCEITHTGEGVDINMNKLRNTMLDFYLISYSTKVMAFSIYNHGTGFSKWISETYNIPYSCQLLH
jgi:hypothetical protein